MNLFKRIPYINDKSLFLIKNLTEYTNIQNKYLELLNIWF